MKALRFLHSFLVWSLGAAWSVWWMSAAMAVALFSSRASLAMARVFWSRPVLWASGARMQVDPLPDVDWGKPHIFAMNHQSTLDIPVAFAVLPANLRFVGKHSLRYVPFVGWYMWMTGMIFVDRKSSTRAVASLR